MTYPLAPSSTPTMIAPNFDVAINGRSVGEGIRQAIESVTYEDNVALADKITLEIADPNTELIDNNVFAEGNVIELSMGYENDLVQMQGATITSVKPHFPDSGIPMITVEALDGMAPLMDTAKWDTPGRNGFNYIALNDASIVAHILTSHWGYLADIDLTARIGNRIHKRDVTDYQFISKLAQLNQFEFYVDWDFEFKKWKGFWKAARDKEAPAYTLQYRNGDNSSLLSFSPEFTIRGQSTEVEMVYYDRQKGKVVKLKDTVKALKADSKPKFIKLETSEITKSVQRGYSAKLSIEGQTIEAITGQSFANHKDAIDWARNWFQQRGDQFVNGTGDAVGHPKIRAGQVNRLLGIGNRFSGDWYFTRVTHKMQKSGPYKIDFAGRKVFAGAFGTPGSFHPVLNSVERGLVV